MTNSVSGNTFLTGAETFKWENISAKPLSRVFNSRLIMMVVSSAKKKINNKKIYINNNNNDKNK